MTVSMRWRLAMPAWAVAMEDPYMASPCNMLLVMFMMFSLILIGAVGAAGVLSGCGIAPTLLALTII